MPETANVRAGGAAVLDRFYTALARKDLGGARACCDPEARFWHNFDAVAQDLEQASRGWQGLFDVFEEHRIADVRREVIPGGYVQRHQFLLRGKDRVLKAKPCCIFVRLEDGLISRLDEYIDLSGDLAVEEGVSGTAGLDVSGAIV